jgi:hypothetical protein
VHHARSFVAGPQLPADGLEDRPGARRSIQNHQAKLSPVEVKVSAATENDFVVTLVPADFEPMLLREGLKSHPQNPRAFVAGRSLALRRPTTDFGVLLILCVLLFWKAS